MARLALLALLVLSGVSGCGAGGGQPGAATVVSVVDGDTIEIRLEGRTEVVRLLGIDTPETVHPTQPVECFGPEASARAAELLAPGTPVLVTRDEEIRDRFDRLLLYVTRAEDGVFVNRALLAEGYARPLSIAPNEAHRAELAAAAAEARRAGRGMWGACPPGPG